MLNRFGSQDKQVQDGWAIDRHTSPSGLYGASGMLVGEDGLLYVAQHYGSQVSTIDTRSGGVGAFVPKGDALPAPDDLAFDGNETMFVTQPQYDRVSIRRPDGTTKVIADVQMANGIAAQGDRVFVNETVPGGRVLEVFADGSEPRVLAEGLMLANGHAIGPDGSIYWSEMMSGEIWRVGLDGGQPEPFLKGLAMPTAVKFSPDGLLTAVCAGNGDVVQCSLSDPSATVIAQMRPGQDNLAFGPDGRLFVSHFIDGGVTELLDNGGGENVLVEPGFLFPFGLTVAGDGTLYAADGMSLRAVGTDGSVARAGTWLEPGFPGWIRSAAAGPDGTVFITSSSGSVVQWDPQAHSGGEPLATGLDEVIGMAWSADTGLLLCEGGAGRVLQLRSDGALSELGTDAERPAGIAVSDRGCFVADEASGSILVMDETGGGRQLCAGLDRPEGVALLGDRLFVLDVGSKELSAVDVSSGDRTVIASGLPVGDPPGVHAPVLPGMAAIGLNGPLSTFADLAVGPDGSLYIGADGEGSILRVRAT